jgi:ABC-type antimicrobial peptide transport system permease subunit
MMNSANFPANDLLRRRLQTSLAIITLTLSFASTLFLLLFTNRLGLGIASASGVLTQGLMAIFSQFTVFLGVLIFAVGAVLSSFIVFLMMAQRTRDFGLIKAAGCPNSLVAGYFVTELLTITLVGCVLGIAIGFSVDYAVANVVFSGYQLPNLWFAPLVFVAYFVLALVFGLQPILKASRMSPIKALSSVNYYGLTVEGKHEPMSRQGITWHIASRSLARRQSATMRIVILLSIVFIMLTVSIGGGIVASETTNIWVQKAVGKNTIAVAHSSMGKQYELLLSKFTGAKEGGDFNYSAANLAIPDAVSAKLKILPSVDLVDSRLVLEEHVQEVANFTIVPDTLQTLPVGDSREADVIVIGVDPQNITCKWSVKGQFLSGTDDLEAVIGDSVSQILYSPHPSRSIVLADPLVEGIRLQNTTFHIVGICVDPLNNGLVTYVPLSKLQNVTGASHPNLLLVKLNTSTDRNKAISDIRNISQTIDSDLEVFDLDGVIQENSEFLSSTWQTIMLVPFFTLASAASCLVGYMMLAIDDQRQEFGVLRAVGAKPKIILHISTIQTMIVLFSSFLVGISIGVVTTLIILMANPIVTIFTVVEIAVWLAAALIAMFLVSLYPALRLSKTSILKIMS